MTPITPNQFFLIHANRGLKCITIHDPANSENLLDLSFKQFSTLITPFNLAGQSMTYQIKKDPKGQLVHRI